MTAAILKLESFDRPAPPVPTHRFDRDDLDQAFADGFAAGRADGDADQLSRLETCLAQLSSLLADDEARRAALRLEAVDALGPILAHLLDLMAPKVHSSRLEDALLAELTRIAGRAAPLSARLLCPPGLRAMAQQCLAATGHPSITLDCREGAELAILLEGGRIEIAPERMARDIAALVAEITEEKP